MSKRFTATTKWDDDWYLGLPPRLKLAWNYLCDTCDGAGVAKVSFALISFRIGEAVTKDEFNKFFGDKIVWIEADKLWLPSFISFQYRNLSVKNHAHRGIMAKIIKATDGLPLNDPQMTLIRGWKESLETLKDIGLGNRISEEIEKGEPEGKKLSGKIIREQLELIYKKFPRKEGKTPGMKTLVKKIHTEQDLLRLDQAVEHYVAFCERKGRAGEFVLMWSTFTNQFEDWLDPDHGQAENFGADNKSLADLDLGGGAA